MLVAPERIKALAPDDVWFPNGRGEIGQAVAEPSRARNALEPGEAPVEDIPPAKKSLCEKTKSTRLDSPTIGPLTSGIEPVVAPRM